MNVFNRTKSSHIALTIFFYVMTTGISAVPAALAEQPTPQNLSFDNCELLMARFPIDSQVAKKHLQNTEPFSRTIDPIAEGLVRMGEVPDTTVTGKSALRFICLDCQGGKGRASVNGTDISDSSLAWASIRVKTPQGGNPAADHTHVLWWQVAGKNAAKILSAAERFGIPALEAESLTMTGGEELFFDPGGPRVVPKSVQGRLGEQSPKMTVNWTEKLQGPYDHNTGGGLSTRTKMAVHANVPVSWTADLIYDKHGLVTLRAHPDTKLAKTLGELCTWEPDGSCMMRGIVDLHTLKAQVEIRLQPDKLAE